jgi:hypothetical protein
MRSGECREACLRAENAEKERDELRGELDATTKERDEAAAALLTGETDPETGASVSWKEKPNNGISHSSWPSAGPNVPKPNATPWRRGSRRQASRRERALKGRPWTDRPRLDASTLHRHKTSLSKATETIALSQHCSKR